MGGHYDPVRDSNEKADWWDTMATASMSTPRPRSTSTPLPRQRDTLEVQRDLSPPPLRPPTDSLATSSPQPAPRFISAEAQSHMEEAFAEFGSSFPGMWWQTIQTPTGKWFPSNLFLSETSVPV